MKQITIVYTDKQSSKEMFQTLNVSDESAAIFAQEFLQYSGGEVKGDSYLYNLLTACRYLSKLEGIQVPDFRVMEPDWIPPIYKA